MSDLQERNSKAVMQALNKQNEILQTYHEKIVSLQTQVSQLQNELIELKKKNMNDLVAKFGSGPTSGAIVNGDKH